MESRTFFLTIRKALVAIAVAATTFTASAHSRPDADPAGESADVKYVGSKNQGLIFNVKYDNASASRFLVIIKNETGEIIFQEAFTDSKFNKNFIFPDADTRKLFFIIGDKKNRYRESFEISSETRIVEDVVVKRIN